MEFESLDALQEDWKPVSRPALLGWLAFYALFLVYAYLKHGDGLFIDLVFLPIHEGGHLLFGWLGQMMGVAGGTILQLGVPLAIAAYFLFQRHLLGTAFASFFFFENFLQIATYMADARKMELPLVTVGNADDVGHDWFILFDRMGVLTHDTQIAAVVRALGWLGMIGVVVWLYHRGKKHPSARGLPPA
ncbi:MAG: hypothetical protein WBN92_09300 [Terriglobia bacterium]